MGDRVDSDCHSLVIWMKESVESSKGNGKKDRNRKKRGVWNVERIEEFRKMKRIN